MTYLLIALLTIYAVYTILKFFGVFESNIGVTKLVDEVKAEKEMNKKRDSEIKILIYLIKFL